MPRGPLGGPRLTTIGPLVEDDRTYYHGAPESESESIMAEGLRAGEADECNSGQGVHVFEKKRQAETWAQVKAEGTSYREPAPYRVWQVVLPEGREIVEDQFLSFTFPGAYVICGEQGVTAENVGKTDILARPDQ